MVCSRNSRTPIKDSGWQELESLLDFGRLGVEEGRLGIIGGKGRICLVRRISAAQAWSVSILLPG